MRITAVGIAALVAATFLGVPTAATARTEVQQLSVTPPMGWNNWAHYMCSIDEKTVRANADALVSTGLSAKGYNTVTVDDCWMAKSRDSTGNLVAGPSFPAGMAALGTYLHNKGLKFGIYEDAGTSTCGGYPGSWNHLTQDANLFASWGVDYVKLDGCNVPSVSGQSSEQTYRSVYSKMGDALRATGRSIVYSESAPAYFQGNPNWYSVLDWVGQYGQLWREGYDVATYNGSASRWGSVMSNYGYNNPIGRYAKPGNWNDPDFLIAGDGGMTDEESRSQVALWAMMAAPMILSSNVAALSATSVATIGNADVIAVDQDSLGQQGTLASSNGTTDVLYKPLANGDRAVAILNRSGSAVTASTTPAAIGFIGGSGCGYQAKNLWTGTSTSTIGATIPSHGTAIFRVTPGSGCAATRPTGQILGTGGKCLDDKASSTTPGNPILLYQCHGGANQRWTRPGDGSIQTLGHCLATTGSNVTLQSCDGSTSQQWQSQRGGELVNASSGLCLDVSGGGSADLTPIIAYACGTNQLNQIWTVPA